MTEHNEDKFGAVLTLLGRCKTCPIIDLELIDDVMYLGNVKHHTYSLECKHEAACRGLYSALSKDWKGEQWLNT